jgi:hypothetical protein
VPNNPRVQADLEGQDISLRYDAEMICWVPNECALPVTGMGQIWPKLAGFSPLPNRNMAPSADKKLAKSKR